jgi:hypothetical protein
MTRFAKLNLRFLSGASLSFAEFRLILVAYGFRLDRVSGSHHVYVHPGLERPMPITPDGKSARPYQMRQARVIIETHGLRMDKA